MSDDTATPITSADASTMADFGGGTSVPESSTETANEVASPPPSREELQAKDVEAFTKAVEEVTPKADDVPTKVEAKEPAAKVEAPVEAATPAPAETDPAALQKAEVDADIRKINDDLKAQGRKGLTKAAEEQFRKLASRPKPEEVEKIVAPLREQAERMAKWDTAIEQTRASGEQIQTALQYIAAYNSGDPNLMGQAADLMFKEVSGMFKALGRELPGTIDALQDHPDLAAAVEDGSVTRKFALETAQARALQARNAEQSQRTQEQQQYQQSEGEAKARLNTLGETLYKADPAMYQAKYAALLPAMKVIRESLHPSAWEAAVFRVYQELPYTPAPTQVQAPPQPKVGSVPLRPTGGNGAQLRAKVPDDPVAAFRFGAGLPT
jgi:hypothetical protein